MPPSSKYQTRVAHLADIHVREGEAYEGFVGALEAASALGAEAILLGGDAVMNSVGADLTRVEAQWGEFHRACRQYPRLTLFPCLGNQDVWGWNQKASGCTGQEPLFGKAMFLRQMALPRTYYATRLRSWRLIVLDGIQRGGRHGFYAKLDAVQRKWLEAELAADRTSPTLVMSHVPLVAGPAEFFAANEFEPDAHGQWCLRDHLVHCDAYDLTSLFRQYDNVRLCLAGHTHGAQRIEYRGVTYVVSPPVSGAWWRGDFMGEPRGFSLVDLHGDGSFEIQTISLPPPERERGTEDPTREASCS
jgi:predicted MPP superfamily phosphohydrolase